MTGRHEATATASQVQYPWRSTARTILQGAVALAAGAPVIYSAASHHDPATAGGGAAVVLGVAAGVTRVMALPVVNDWLGRFLPFLAATPKPAETAPSS